MAPSKWRAQEAWRLFQELECAEAQPTTLTFVHPCPLLKPTLPKGEAGHEVHKARSLLQEKTFNSTYPMLPNVMSIPSRTHSGAGIPPLCTVVYLF